MDNKTYWKNLGTKAALYGVNVSSELFSDVVRELNKLSQRLQEQMPKTATDEAVIDSKHDHQTPPQS